MQPDHGYALPQRPPAETDTLTKHFLIQFMQEFHSQRGADGGARILAAIGITSTKTGNAPEVIARALVENGLRGSKDSFPPVFVKALAENTATPDWVSSLTPAQRELLDFWNGNTGPTGYRQARHSH